MDIDPNKCVAYIMENAPKFAQAKAERVFIENFLRPINSRLIQNGQGTKNAFLRTRKQLEIAQVWCCERMLTLLHHPLDTCTY